MVGMGQRPRIRTIQARDLQALQWEVQEARHRFRLPDTVTTLSCFEAGRDGFWLHRYLHEERIANLVVDPACIEVSRRSKQAKTDMLDVDKLLLKFRPQKAGYDYPLTLQFVGRRPLLVTPGQIESRKGMSPA